MTRESLRRPSKNSGSMSSVAQPICRLPAAYASRIAIGSSISTSSTLKSLPPGVFHVLPGLNPLLARMIGLQPAQTLMPKRTVRSASRLVAGDALDLGQARGGDVVVFLDRRDARAVGRFGAPSASSSIHPPRIYPTAIGPDRAIPPERKTHEAEHHEQDGNVERRSGLSVGHEKMLLLILVAALKGCAHMPV